LCPTCLAAILADGWCDGCKVGYANGRKTSCKGCFEAMTSPAGGWCADCKVGYARGLKTKCKTCLAAIQADGWCDGCKVGYAGGRKTSCKCCFAAMKSADGGWCEECGVGHARGLTTKCPKCFAAIRSDGACQDCGTRFKGGRSFRRVALHVHGLAEGDAAAAIREILAKQKAAGAPAIDKEAEQVAFELETTGGDAVEAIIEAFAAAGFEAHEGDH
jgi:hypothetical protein